VGDDEANIVGLDAGGLDGLIDGARHGPGCDVGDAHSVE
jgi:hypothetical protein